MLNRRHFRVKTLQALFAYILSENDNLASGQKLLLNSLDKLHELYINQLSLLVEINEYALQKQEEAKLKFFPTPDELNPNTRFVDNIFINAIAQCEDYQKYFNKYNINWSIHPELIKKLFREIRETKEYTVFMAGPADDANAHAQFVSKIIRHVFENNDFLTDFYEDKNLYWGADFELSLDLVLKTIKYFVDNNFILTKLPSLLKEDEFNQREDLEYMKLLFAKTIFHNDEYDRLIQAHLENWELDRMAVMDNLLIKMALCELTEFPSIPVKVTLNEYIELSKSFSTPKSSHFINGILDKLLLQLKEEKKLMKKGRGLMEG